MIYMFKATHFRSMCLKIYELDPAHCLSSPALAWQGCLKNTGAKLELLANINMLLIIEKGIRGRLTHAIYRYAKTNNKYMKILDKNKELSCLMYLDANNLYGWTMFQKLPINVFKWKKIYLYLMKNL